MTAGFEVDMARQAEKKYPTLSEHQSGPSWEEFNRKREQPPNYLLNSLGAIRRRDEAISSCRRPSQRERKSLAIS